MVTVKIARDTGGFIRRITIEGHAGYDKTGRDIVCAAVSVTAYTAAGALGELAGLNECYYTENGRMVISVPDNMESRCRQTAGIILETTMIGFRQIEMEYGKFIKVLEEEV